jgi:ATP-dependent helicase/nuclease subunit A
MSRSPSIIPPDVLRVQGEVSDPGVSAWVAANAGSGKTHVLAQRVINLLLAGVAPEKILCLTFTKAAAANMAKRVFDTLGRWTTLDDEALDAAIGSRPGRMPAARRALARRLFARALETPGGLKVQTIHGFCTQLLHQFPFEANVAARFTVLDETAQMQLLEDLTLAALLEGASAPESALGRALGIAMTAGADQTFRDVVREAINSRDAFINWRLRAGSVEDAVAELSRTLGIAPEDTLESVEAAFFHGSLIPETEWPAIAAALARGNKTDGEQAHRFTALTGLTGANRVELYLEIFCTDEGNPRKSIVTKAVKDARLVERLNAEQARVCDILERRNAVICRDRSGALLAVVDAVLRRYAAEKERRGLLDYDDLIDKTLWLLNSVDAAWVHYKLDLGIDHVLIDEAQDTSDKQWHIVRLLAAEFTAGKGARDLTRTVFAVGDEKQSIFSFQDAAPKQFAAMHRHFEKAHDAAGLEFMFREFKHSFRSGASVLAAVDEVFKAPGMAASVTADSDGFPPHIALPDAPPSVVEIWEPEKPDERKEIEGWDAPFDTVSETSPRVKLAQRIARTVRRLVDGGMQVGINRRAARYGDVLILVRQRGPLFEAIIRALKNEHVEVAGADRLVLTEHIAVMDLIALADALLLPADDLALATVLRSPLFGFSDEDLFAIAADRGRSSLRSALKKKSSEREIFAQAAARLDMLRDAARRQSPFAFYASVLGAGGGRKSFNARLGAEANDALDEFLNLTLDYERREIPSLQGFVAWLRAARAEVKRDMEIARDEVRVMTVHGAKGLEAPIVILADTMTQPSGPRPPRLLELPDGAVIWAGRKDDDVPPVAAARQAALAEAEDEYRRLLYVAMTRAADRLIVCGADGERQRPKGCWYDLVAEPLRPFLIEEADNGETVWRFRREPPAIAETSAPAAAEAKAQPPELPQWLRQPPSPQTQRSIVVSPSAAFEEEDGQSFAVGAASPAERRRALARGRIVHRLMQSLPDIPQAGRKAAIEHYLRSAAADFAPAERAEVAQRVLTILNDLIFADLFTPGSRAEVPIVGRILRTGAPAVGVAGQVDRLAVTRDSVLIADYKTDRSAPRRLAEVPERYIRQLALYRTVLGRIYPGRTIRAALIFTEGPAVIEVPASVLEASLEAFLEGSLAEKAGKVTGQ